STPVTGGQPFSEGLPNLHSPSIVIAMQIQSLSLAQLERITGGTKISAPLPIGPPKRPRGLILVPFPLPRPCFPHHFMDQPMA
ncbi:MAG: hypothetical protein ACK56I_09935, partial [bacterium]